jgi:hypothetical protein
MRAAAVKPACSEVCYQGVVWRVSEPKFLGVLADAECRSQLKQASAHAIRGSQTLGLGGERCFGLRLWLDAIEMRENVVTQSALLGT